MIFLLLILLLSLVFIFVYTPKTSSLTFKTVMFRANHLPKGTKYQNVLRDLLFEMQDVLKQCDIPFWLSEGTALGAIRESDIILNDTDVDIGIFVNYKDKFYEQALPLLVKKGFALGRGSQHDQTSLTSLYKQWGYVDIDFTGENHRCVALDHRVGDCKPIMQVLQPWNHNARIQNRTFTVPSMEYIVLLYGLDWDIPKANFKPSDVTRM